MPVNSLMSAPAMKPLFLPEITTRPRGGTAATSSSSASSSRSTWLESTLTEVPGLSAVSQTMPSPSRSIFQARVAVSVLFTLSLPFFRASGAGSGRGGSLRGSIGPHVEIADERAVIREAHIGHTEVGHLDALAHQDEIELDARHPCRK